MLKEILKLIGTSWDEIRNFSFTYKTIFEVFFLFLYTTEQVFLIWVVTKMQLTQTFRLDIIGYFALLVLLTFALHKLVIESRVKILEENVSQLKHNIDIYRAVADRTVELLGEQDNVERFKNAENQIDNSRGIL